MLKRTLEAFESVTATVIGGVFLLASLLVPIIFDVEIPMYIDPAWVAVVLSGIPLFVGAIRKLIFNKGISKISSALLISIAMIASIAIGDLFAAGEIAFIMAIGEILEDKTTERAKKGLKNLIGLTPVQGRRIKGETEEMIAAEEIKVGDILRILPGEAMPVDGVIISGETSVDQSVMTGESLPVDKTVGDNVFCGTVNRFGSVDIRASKVGEDSSLQKLIRMVKEAENKKAPIQRIADKWASLLVPVALLIAVAAGIIMKDVIVAVTVLVVFCPCALVLATPTAIMAAIGQATKHGVIIKSGEALERMGKVDTVAFDKTGTLTFGELQVSDIVPFDTKADKNALLALAASAESKSEHPLGKAIVAYAKDKKIKLEETELFTMEAGKGICADIAGAHILCGNEKYIAEKGIALSETEKSILEDLRSQGKASVIIAKNGSAAGVIAMSDTVRPEAKGMVEKLRKMSTDTVLLTGDNKQTAEHFSKKVGITRVYADLLPEEKVSKIAELESEGNTVCMIGDGVNDAPALKTADVGVAMGTMGSDIAVEAADIALIGDDISKLPYLKRLSNATSATIRISITMSLVINFAAIVLSLLKLLDPTTGALVHNAGSCFVVLFAALLYDRKFDK